ncbi:FAD/NAD(P)-binding domain-containing protein [Polyplosphaeria fusca]|uniref:FAD/NAD(P)-binding domain-containing protein n=1 Tax=Polyplosphaeria fusca TaxID=682080 RepID=A0A9P4QLP6_9PLEO|nr:FAD/NAD(P)-binding domain-containing protein [Polyplosphaeria fusca]
MNIIITGAGIAGLTTALSLRRAHHQPITIYERSPTATAFGAGISLGPNCTRILTSFGLDYAKWRITKGTRGHVYDGTSLARVGEIGEESFRVSDEEFQAYAHRVDLQNALLELVTGEEGEGTPVRIVYGAGVTAYDCDAGSITLESGAQHFADLVIAADGMHSLAPAAVLGRDVRLRDTGVTVVRFMLAASVVAEDPVTASLFPRGLFSFFFHADRRRFLLHYPVRDGEELNFGMYRLEEGVGEGVERMLRFTCDREGLERELEGFGEGLVKLAGMAGDVLPVWRLQDREPLERWWRGRVLVVGDAAHPMLPMQGQGAAMCVEDAGALGHVFSGFVGEGDGKMAIGELENRFRAFESVRRGRVSVVQLISRLPYHRIAVDEMWDELCKFMNEDELPGRGGNTDVRNWLGRYNLEDACKRAMEDVGLRDKSFVA